jgi:hypothetical protein
MALRTHSLDVRLGTLDRLVAELPQGIGGSPSAAIKRWRADLAAMRFHLNDTLRHPLLLAIIGGTGTGKSTIVNRLLDSNCSATSFRRTFTTGAVAVAQYARSIPSGWLGIEHSIASDDQLPARGQPDRLVIATVDSDLTRNITLVDTPDLDGDQPAHHAQADRAFRWAQAAVFLVTPEKYQMTELLPYYRLARRYAIPVIFAMNKCDDDHARSDWSQLLIENGFAGRRVFAIPRDDAAFEPPADADLPAMRQAIQNVQRPDGAERELSLTNRAADLMDRFADQVLLPLRDARADADRIIASLRSFEMPPAQVDVNPITQQLQRRMQERSVLYLIGPQRMIDRVRQAPGMIARLPRNAWDWIMNGDGAKRPEALGAAIEDRKLPDFRAILIDQMTVVQSRIDDSIRAAAAGGKWIESDPTGFAAAKFDADQAGQIADQEIDDLRLWLEQRWNASPQDTAILHRLFKHLPGGEKLTQWSEAAPYLLAIVVATHGALFGHLDLLILGGYSLTTWIMEKMSNEVASRTRSANRRIADRFARLVHDQIVQMTEWINHNAPAADDLRKLERAATEVSESLG